MWVNPNIVYPPGKPKVTGPRKEEDLPGMPPSCQPPLKEEAPDVQLLRPSYSEQLPPQEQEKQPKWKHVTSSPSTWEEVGLAGLQASFGQYLGWAQGWSISVWVCEGQQIIRFRNDLSPWVGGEAHMVVINCSPTCHCTLELWPRSQDQILPCAPVAYRRGGGQGPG